MKLSNFYDKGKSPKRQTNQTKFTLSNGRLELDLKEEQTKNLKLQEQHTMLLNEQDELHGQINVLQEHSNSMSTDFEQITSTLELKEATYHEAQQQSELIPDLQQQIRNLESDNSNLTGIIDSAQKTHGQQQIELETITQQKDMLFEEKTQIKGELDQRRKDVFSFQAKADEFKEKFEGIQTVMDALKIDYKETQRSRNNLWDQAAYWEGKATEFYERVQAIEEIDVKLREWITSLKVDSTEAQSASKNAKHKLMKLTRLVADMGETISTLTLDKDSLSQMNAAFKKELTKPRYMSMGAIARKEGFKMPTNQDNIRTKFLGNAAPTLLKFKGKEENNAR